MALGHAQGNLVVKMEIEFLGDSSSEIVSNALERGKAVNKAKM